MVMSLLKGQSGGVSKVVVGRLGGFKARLAIGCGLSVWEVWVLEEGKAKLLVVREAKT